MHPARPTSVAGFALLSVLAGCTAAGGEPRPHASAAPASVQSPGAPRSGPQRLAARLLDELPVQPRAPKAGYARDQFGPPWQDVDRNGCDTRDDILQRDLTDARLAAGRRACVVEAGRLADPYTGADIEFHRGRAASIDIDHVVALGNAWVTGAAGWEPRKRIALANDPLNLLAVDAGANRAKGDADAAEWLPPNASYHCAYVARQIAVKAKYQLWATADERDTWTRVLRSCPDEPAPAGDAPVLAPVADPPHSPAPDPAPTPAPKPEPPRARDPNYGTCKEAKAHGAGPYHRGRDPEYDYYQDRDGDGVVCE